VKKFKIIISLAFLFGMAIWSFFNQPSPPPFEKNCDGRVWCSEMTSCDEAKFFVRNCPGTKMDGDGDGVPCERQWCNGLFDGIF